MTYQQIRTYPSNRVSEQFPRSGKWLDALTIFWLYFPIIGTFFSPETYFARGTGELLPYPITPLTLVLCSITAIFMFVRLRIKMKILHEYSIYIYFLIALISISSSWAPTEAFNRLLRMLPGIAFAIIYAQYYSTPRFLKLLTIAFLFSALSSMFVALFFPIYGIGYVDGVYEGSWRGALAHKNTAGAVYGIGVLILIFAQRIGAISFKLFISTFIVCFITLVMTQSATGLFGMIASASVAITMLFIRRFSGGANLLIMVAVLLFLITLILVVMLVPDMVVSMTGRDLTFTGRTPIWAAVWQQIQANPISGYGYTFWWIDSPARRAIWEAVGYPNPHSHNSWLDIWLQIGIFGLATMAYLLAKCLAVTGRLALTSSGVTGVYLVMIPVFFLFASMTDVLFTDPSTAGVFWITWAAVTARREQASLHYE